MATNPVATRSDNRDPNPHLQPQEQTPGEVQTGWVGRPNCLRQLLPDIFRSATETYNFGANQKGN